VVPPINSEMSELGLDVGHQRLFQRGYPTAQRVAHLLARCHRGPDALGATAIRAAVTIPVAAATVRAWF
jgi:hypothetical protein